MEDRVVWSPALWHVLHTISFNYRVEPDLVTQRQYQRFLESIETVFYPYMELAHPELDYGPNVYRSRDNFSRYIHELRTSVQSTHERPFRMSYYSLRRRYECFRARCAVDKSNEKHLKTASGRERGCRYAAYRSVGCRLILEHFNKPRRQAQMKIDKRCRISSAQFHEDDYKSGSGMVTRIWGGALWHVLHCIAMRYPLKPTRSLQTAHRRLFESLEYVLPCCYCRQNYPHNLKCSRFNPQVFSSRNALTRFVYRLHNCVNRCLGKPKFDMTFAAWRRQYQRMLSDRYRCTIEIVPPDCRNRFRVC